MLCFPHYCSATCCQHLGTSSNNSGDSRMKWRNVSRHWYTGTCLGSTRLPCTNRLNTTSLLQGFRLLPQRDHMIAELGESSSLQIIMPTQYPYYRDEGSTSGDKRRARAAMVRGAHRTRIAIAIPLVTHFTARAFFNQHANSKWAPSRRPPELRGTTSPSRTMS